jgi:hypothetical protein
MLIPGVLPPGVNVTTEQELREKLRKIEALFEGATTVGERDAAAAASSRILAALNSAGRAEPAIETQFTLPDRWSRLPLCAAGTGLSPTVTRDNVTLL